MIRPFILLLLILILGSFLRFYLIQEYPLGLYPNEAMNGNNALEALATGKFKIFYPENNGREGLFINLQAISLKIFGNEPWALRIVSAIFGTLTILGIYLLTKELFEKSQFLISNSQSNSNDSIFKSLKIEKLKNSLKNKNWEIENYEIIALLTAFFLATSYWHLNFSRIGFRAISVPFFAVFGLYFLLKGLRLSTYSSSEDKADLTESRSFPKERFSTSSNNIIYLVSAGVFIGLGFHTYIAFRFMPFVLIVPLIWYFWQWRQKNQNFRLRPDFGGQAKLKAQNDNVKLKNLKYCTP